MEPKGSQRFWQGYWIFGTRGKPLHAFRGFRQTFGFALDQALDQGDHQESNKELLTHVWAKPAFLLSPLS